MKSHDGGTMSSGKKKNKDFDKYYYYHKSVQSADVDVKFFLDTYKEINDKKPTSFREDFCGTFSLSCEWAKLKDHHTSFGVDLDPEPIAYGKENYYPKLSEDQQKRVHIQENNVLAEDLPKTDIIAACNFSYFIFKERETLKKYFKNCLETLNEDGVFIMDIFGGSQCYEPNEEETEHDGFSYFWDQDSYDPVTNEGMFFIHFKPKGQKKVKRAFTYDWRMWSIPEIKDILKEVGFKNVHVYWEGTDEDGEGDGEFKRVTKGEDCESWVAYIVSEKP
ncbi:MAG: class I SAM-dependent methyltransferase [Bdellovibrionales bacterium]|nr:class I SAM-dependent methyltransferase [Bdellovibrionales bacterium]